MLSGEWGTFIIVDEEGDTYGAASTFDDAAGVVISVPTYNPSGLVKTKLTVFIDIIPLGFSTILFSIVFPNLFFTSSI